jgi:hypothetical protein
VQKFAVDVYVQLDTDTILCATGHRHHTMCNWTPTPYYVQLDTDTILCAIGHRHHTMCKWTRHHTMCNWTPTPYVGVYSKFVQMLERLIATVSVPESVSKKERQGITETPPIPVHHFICSSTTIPLRADRTCRRTE